MKKIGSLLLIGTLTLSLAACGGADEEANSQEVSEETTTAQQDETTEAATDAETFTITATNWEFSSDKELVIKKGSTVQLNLVNEEGFHTISNEELGIDLSPDKPAEFTADKTGEFELICSTICGATDDHEAMTITLKVIE